MSIQHRLEVPNLPTPSGDRGQAFYYYACSKNYLLERGQEMCDIAYRDVFDPRKNRHCTDEF